MAEAPSRLEHAEELGYEPVDANIRRLLWIAFGWSVFVGLGAGVMIGLIHLFDALRPPFQVSPVARVEIVPPEPRLEANPQTTLDRVREHEDHLLNGYALVDPRNGIARIPIDRAMAILAERGWPTSPKSGANGQPASPEQSSNPGETGTSKQSSKPGETGTSEQTTRPGETGQ